VSITITSTTSNCKFVIFYFYSTFFNFIYYFYIRTEVISVIPTNIYLDMLYLLITIAIGDWPLGIGIAKIIMIINNININMNVNIIIMIIIITTIKVFLYH